MTPGRDAHMLDGRVFDELHYGRLHPAVLVGKQLFITEIQVDELRAIPDEKAELRARLLKLVESVAPELVPASSFCLGIEGAGFGQGLWNDGSGRFDKMLSRLKQLDRKAKSQHRNQLRDVLIAETAIKLHATLVTCDGKLKQMVREFGGQVVAPSDLRPTPEAGAAAAEPSPGG